MFAQALSPLLGALFISLGLINLSSNINPSLHLFMHDLLKQVHENTSVQCVRNISLNHIKTIFSICLLVSGFILHFCEGIKRLFVLIPLLIISIYVIESAVIYGITLASVPIYIILSVAIIIILFNDCTQLDELDS